MSVLIPHSVFILASATGSFYLFFFPPSATSVFSPRLILGIFRCLSDAEAGHGSHEDPHMTNKDAWALLHPVSYRQLRAHETPEQRVCRLLLEKKKTVKMRVYRRELRLSPQPRRKYYRTFVERCCKKRRQRKESKQLPEYIIK